MRSGESCGSGRRARYSPVCLAPPARQRRRGSSTPPAADPRSGPPGRPEAAAERRAYAARARRSLPSSPARAGPCPVSPAPHSCGDLRATPASFPSAARSRPPQGGRLPQARLGRGAGTLCPPPQLPAARFTRYPGPDFSPPSRPRGERTAQAQTTKSQLRRRRACAEAGEHPPPLDGTHLPGGGTERRVLSCPGVVSGGWDVPCCAVGKSAVRREAEAAFA